MTISIARRQRQRANRRKKFEEEKCAKIIQRAYRNFHEMKVKSSAAKIIQRALRKKLHWKRQLSARVIQRAFRNRVRPVVLTYENVITHAPESSDEESEYNTINDTSDEESEYDTVYDTLYGIVIRAQSNVYSVLNRNITIPEYVPFAPAMISNSTTILPPIDSGIYVDNVIEPGIENLTTNGNGYYEVVHPN